MAERFRPSDRIRKAYEHRALLASGERVHSKHFVWILGPSLSGSPRLGTTVSKRAVPRAVDRNRVKRVVRDAFRRHRSMVPAGVEMVLVAKAGAHTISAGAFLGEWSGALPAMRRAGERLHRR